MFADRTRWNLTSNRLSKALARHRSGGRRLLDLSASNPTECGFHYDTGAIMRALCSPASLGYHPDPQGLKSAREAVAGYYAHRGEYVFIEDVLLTTSTSEAYSFIFRLLCNPGDELLIPTPSYPLFDFLADLQDVKLKPYPLIYDHGWQIDFHALEAAIGERTRGIILVHPNNPTGHFTTLMDLAELNRLCSAHGLALIADEVFLDFGIKGRSPSLSANREAPTFTLSGLSKISGLPQMKFAWLIVSGPEDWKREALARLEVIADTYLSMNAPIQHAAPAFLKQRHGFQRQLMERVLANLEELDRQLAEFFNFLGHQVGLANVWIALSADHGVSSLPDAAKKLRIPAANIDVGKLSNQINSSLSARFSPGHSTSFINFDYPLAWLNQDAFADAHVKESDAENAVGAAMKQAGLRGYYTKSQLAAGEVPDTAMGRLFLNSYSPEGPWYVMGVIDPYNVGSSKGTDHATPYSYDRHVPLAFYGLPFQSGTYYTHAEPVDLAATLAALLGINAPTHSVGRVLTEALAPPHRTPTPGGKQP